MSAFVARIRRCSLVSIGFDWVIAVASCGPRSTPPGADSIGTSAPGMSISYLRWKEGLMVLFIDDVKGAHSSQGSGSTDNPVHTAKVTAGSPEAGGYECQIDTTDGKSARCSINGKEYDLSKGTLFVIKAKGEQAEVNQLKRDLTTIPFDAQGCREPLQKDAEIRKLLGLSDLPK